MSRHLVHHTVLTSDADQSITATQADALYEAGLIEPVLGMEFVSPGEVCWELTRHTDVDAALTELA